MSGRRAGSGGRPSLALVDGSPNRAGKLLTIRQHEQLMTYRARLEGDAVQVLSADGRDGRLDESLVARLAAETSRPLTLRDLKGANFDDSPVLVVNLATVAEFGARAGMQIDHRRFRANLYVAGIPSEAEIGWLGRRLLAGQVELEVTSRCERCVIITRDPDTTATAPELLRVLAETQETCMGMYCRVSGPGLVAVGDSIRVV